MIVPSVTPLLRQLPCCHPRNDHRASRCASVTPLLWRLPCCHARNDHFGRRRPQPDPRKQEPAIRACRRDGPAPGLEPTPRWKADPHPRRPRRRGAEAAQQHAPNSDQRTGGPPPPGISARDFGRRARLATAPRGMARADPHSARRSAKRAQMRSPRIRNAPRRRRAPSRADPHRLLSPTDTAHPRATPGAARNFGRRAQLRAPRATSGAARDLRAPPPRTPAPRDLQPPRAAWRAQILTPRADPQNAGRSASPAHPQRPRSPPPTTPTRGTTSRRNGVSTYEEEVP